MINVRKLKAKMTEREFSQEKLADAMKIDRSSVNRKINDESGHYMKCDEAQDIKDILQMTDDEFVGVFAWKGNIIA